MTHFELLGRKPIRKPPQPEPEIELSDDWRGEHFIQNVRHYSEKRSHYLARIGAAE